MNVANQISIFRIVLVPIFLIAWLYPGDGSHPGRVVATIVFIVAAISDLVDGYYARNYERVTRFGKWIDPVADKLLVTAALLCLVELHRVGAWVAMIMIGRDIAITNLRTLVAAQGDVVGASPLGKAKTAWQMTAIITALVFVAFDEILALPSAAGAIPAGALGVYRGWSQPLVDVLMWGSAIVSIWSAVDYFQTHSRHVEDSTKPE